MPTAVTKRLTQAASGGQTSRVTESPQGSALQSRISHLLLLEGDESGHLLLEGDMQDVGTDALRLEGDVTVIGGTNTVRITGPVI